MKPVKLIAVLITAVLCYCGAGAQTGYIYVHLKHVNEESSPDYSFTLKNSSGTTVSTFSLNDQATNNNTSTDLAANYFSTLDAGLSHGTNGDAQLWTIASTTIQSPNSGKAGTIYMRPSASATWTTTAVTTAIAIDGAFANQCVYVNSSGNVFFYYNGTSVQIYSGGNATDVTANGTRIAIVAGGVIKLYSAAYSAGTLISTSGASWSNILTVSTTTRIDMNLGATSIAYITAGSNVIKTTSLTGTVTTLTSPGTSGSAYYYDIAYDDLGYIYTIANNSAGELNVFSYNGTVWTDELQARLISNITAGAGHMCFGITYAYASNTITRLYSRQVDNAGNIYWIDDERQKSNISYNGNTIIIPVTPGTYTLTETLPGSTYDLGRINLYDPGGASSYSIDKNTVTFIVTANEVVFGEYVNEKLNPKAIALNCTFQYLQTFDASNSSPVYTYTFGNSTYGTQLEGTAYHYRISSWSDVLDGDYEIEKTATDWQNSTLADHTGNGGYFLLVNAAYSKDEFYRQRVTNLVPGLSYTISFYAADLSPSSPLRPSLTFGLQDSLGVVVNTAATGSVTSTSWKLYSFTFTATTSKADLFISNAGIGGSGNDLAIDDIAINPIIPTITTAASKDNICKGSTYNFGKSPAGGLWTSSNTAVATIDQNGVATGIGAGSTVLTYTYTNSIGCTAISNNTLKITTGPVIKATDKLGGASCFNQVDSLFATITTASSPSSPTYSYTWVANPAANAGLGTATVQNTVAKPTAAGSFTYTVTATDTAGCTGSGAVTVVVSNNGAPTVSATANATLSGCTVTLVNLSGSVSAPLNPNYSYTWSGPGTIAGASGSGAGNSSTFAATATGITTGGQYTLTVTAANGCVGTATAPTFIPGPLSVTAGTYATALCSNTVDSLYSTAAGGTAPYTYAWTRTSGSGTATYSPGTSYDTTGVTLSGATNNGAQNFQIKVTDTKGCTATATTSFTYKNVTGPSIGTTLWPTTNVCLGSIIYFPPVVTAGSGTVTSYAWGASPSSTAGLYHTLSTTTSKDTAKPTVAGTYAFTLNVTDANGCETSATSTQTVLSSLTVVVSANTSAFCGGASGSATDQLFAVASGGDGSYTYAWGTPTITGSGSSSYSSTTVYNPTATISGANASSTFKYPVTVSDGSGCSGTGSTTVLPTSTAPSVTGVTATPALSCGNTGNTITLTASFSGGGAPYNYAWTPPSNSVVTPASGTASTSPVTATATAETAQNYSFGFSIIDKNNCQASGATSTVVTVNPVPSATAVASSYSMCVTPASTINLTGTVTDSTTGPYTYSWSGSGVANTNSTTTTAVPAAPGTYSFMVTDANGCTGTGTTPTVNADQATPSITTTCGTTNGINYIRLFENNGVSWTWTGTTGNRFYAAAAIDVSNDSDVSHLQGPYVVHTGTYNVTIKNSSNCIGSAPVVVSTASCPSVLAFNLVGFTGQRKGDDVLLQWHITGDNTVKGFTIERSTNGRDFIVAGNVTAGTNNSSYNFTDNVPYLGCVSLYYRLKETTNDGGIVYSNIAIITCNANDVSDYVLQATPNPVRAGSNIKLSFTAPMYVTKAKIIISNALGQAGTMGISNTGGLNMVVLPIQFNMIAGTYFIKIVSDKWISKTIKIIKAD